MAAVPRSKAKTAHVNMMTDTIIANLPADALRSVVRAILTTAPMVTPIFEEHTRNYLQKTAGKPTGDLFISTAEVATPTSNAILAQQRLRSTIGCGLVFESLPLLGDIVDACSNLPNIISTSRSQDLNCFLASVDGDIVQALTAVQKRLLSDDGSRDLTVGEDAIMNTLLDRLLQCLQTWLVAKQEFPFGRSTSVIAAMLHNEAVQSFLQQDPQHGTHIIRKSAPSILETFKLKGIELPRLFSGLWQLSSPSWGAASQSQMFKQFADYIACGFTAFDTADHYGDAEVIFGRLRSILPSSNNVFGATKYCVFHKINVTPEVVRVNITERCQRMNAETVDLLQFHWQDYGDHQYIEALRLIQQDERVRNLGLCNFDTERLQEVLKSGINIVTNQVQFSLIDARPRYKMGEICDRHDVKLLTYGTLCGGFLAEKWLDQPEPQLFGSDSTPSQRKYFEMIQTWGDWNLFQVLLQTLSAIANKHSVSISNVASRWVLDLSYVGAVIVGARMGVSEHTEENLKTYGWRLDDEDQEMIESVLQQSRRDEVFNAMGDCGSEYR